VEADDLSVGTRNRSARRNWNSLSDRAAGEREMVVRLDVSRKSMNTATCRRAFVRNNCAAWKIRGDWKNRESPYAKRAETQRKLLAHRRITPERLGGPQKPARKAWLPN